MRTNGLSVSALASASDIAKSVAAPPFARSCARLAPLLTCARVLRLAAAQLDDSAHLSEFDVKRPIRPVITDRRLVSIKFDLLKDEMICNVCLNIIQDAVVRPYTPPRHRFRSVLTGCVRRASVKAVMECLHRFCNACMETSLRRGIKECPACRVFIPSRRYMRPDGAFDRLIGRIYKDPV